MQFKAILRVLKQFYAISSSLMRANSNLTRFKAILSVLKQFWASSSSYVSKQAKTREYKQFDAFKSNFL